MNCPKCGSNQVNSEYKGAFACGTLTDRNGWYHQTNFCKEFAELRKPLDAQIQQLETERDALQARVNRLEKAGDAMADVLAWSSGVHYRRSKLADAWCAAKESKP